MGYERKRKRSEDDHRSHFKNPRHDSLREVHSSRSRNDASRNDRERRRDRNRDEVESNRRRDRSDSSRRHRDERNRNRAREDEPRRRNEDSYRRRDESRRRHEDSYRRKDESRRRNEDSYQRKEERKQENDRDGSNRRDPSRDRSNRREPSRDRSNRREPPPPPIQDDREGHLIYKNGDVILNKFEIVDTLGEGTFGKVVKVKDTSNASNKYQALKIIKNVSKYRFSAEFEIRVLNTLKEKDIDGKNGVIELLGHFNYYGHICLLFDWMGLSIYDFLKLNHYNPFTLDHTRYIAYQLCHSVKFLHDNKLTHTDLKPENILFVNSEFEEIIDEGEEEPFMLVKDATIRLIDLGSATFDDEHHTTIVSTRHYRAPEVILELGWSQPCDVWSIGCILYELYSGDTLFPTAGDRKHLATMERILGKIPYRMAKKSKLECFLHGKLDWDSSSEAGHEVHKKHEPLRRLMDSNEPEHVELFELIETMLVYDPSKRVTLDEALESNFFARLPENLRVPSLHPKRS